MRKLSALFIALVAITILTGCIRANPAKTPLEADGVIAKNETTFIGEDKAKEIVLAKAGLSAEEVSFDRVELDNDRGVWHYEIEFRHGYKEYSADVNALDGTVRDYEVDIDD